MRAAPRFIKRELILWLAVPLLLAVAVRAMAQDKGRSTPAGTSLYNQAQGGYHDLDGAEYRPASEVVAVTVQASAGVQVTPDDSAPSSDAGLRETLWQNFTICNTGNSANAFRIASLTVTTPARLLRLYYDIDESHSLTGVDLPVTIGTTETPLLKPGACLGVLAKIDTDSTSVGSPIYTVLRASASQDRIAGSQSEDIGTIITTVRDGPRLTSPMIRACRLTKGS